MTEADFDQPIPLSDMLSTLQREISRVQDDSLLVLPGSSRALIADDLTFSVQFNFTPVAALTAAENDGVSTFDSILVDAAGAHQMTLTGKLCLNVSPEAQPLGRGVT
ncbi:hypothetical protein N9V19_03455 [Opitutales bacterium]|jgi:hypothetical protein|nr:hypothetical protein [Opitutales bacterium]MDB2311035.1 hypothetical protein [Opitutales bacterium]